MPELGRSRSPSGLWPGLLLLSLSALPVGMGERAVAQPEPAGSEPAPAQPASSPGRGELVTYKIKLTEGTAWTNLNPESWMVFDVSDGTRVAVRHSTNVLNMITSISRWWDHPVTASKACRISVGETGKRLTGCLSGSDVGTGKSQRHVLLLPAETTIHDYMFEIQWQEKGLTQEAVIQVPAGTKPASVKALPPP